MIDVKQNGSVYELKFRYDPYLIALVKNVPGRRWDADAKLWTIPSEHLGWLINELKDTPYESTLNISSGENLNKNETLDSTSVSEIPDIDISDVDHYVQAGYSLYPHQVDFLKYAKSRNGAGFILADEMGCGKTLEVTNYALYQRKIHSYKHCLIICCVNSAKFSWQEDIEKHTNGMETGYILGTRRRRDGTCNYSTGGKEKLEDLITGHMYGDKTASELPYFLILNIESLRMKVGKRYAIAEEIVNMIIKREIRMIAIDEVHKNMSPKSAQGKLILAIKKKTGRIAEWVPMTGTPIVNRPTDVFTPLRLVDGHSIKSYWEWCQKFVIYGGYGDHEVMGYKNIKFLKEMLQKNMLRRLKEDVLDLPDKIYYTEYVENTPIQQKLYINVQAGIYSRRDEILKSSNPLSEMLRLRQVNGSPELIDESIPVDAKYITKNAKLKRTLELVDEIVERGEKVAIFSNWVAPLKTLYKFIASRHKTCCFTGTMSEADRQKHKHVFINNPEYKIMIGTIGALGTNHTLTVANNVIFYDSPWTHAERNQAIDRCHRISAKSNVNVYTIITKDTIDETVHKILEEKKDVSGYIVDGKLDIRNNPELFDKLLGKIR